MSVQLQFKGFTDEQIGYLKGVFFLGASSVIDIMDEATEAELSDNALDLVLQGVINEIDDFLDEIEENSEIPTFMH